MDKPMVINGHTFPSYRQQVFSVVQVLLSIFLYLLIYPSHLLFIFFSVLVWPKFSRHSQHPVEPEFDATGVPYWWPRYLMLVRSKPHILHITHIVPTFSVHSSPTYPPLFSLSSPNVYITLISTSKISHITQISYHSSRTSLLSLSGANSEPTLTSTSPHITMTSCLTHRIDVQYILTNTTAIPPHYAHIHLILTTKHTHIYIRIQGVPTRYDDRCGFGRAPTEQIWILRPVSVFIPIFCAVTFVQRLVPTHTCTHIHTYTHNNTHTHIHILTHTSSILRTKFLVEDRISGRRFEVSTHLHTALIAHIPISHSCASLHTFSLTAPLAHNFITFAYIFSYANRPRTHS